MKVYGLTGGIGMGKSTSDKLLRNRGVAVVDTDLIARQLVEPGQPALAEIQTLFGPDIVTTDGHLRRDELGRRVFGDSVARKQLEAILHPRIRAVWQDQVEQWRTQKFPRVVVVIPLLFETDASAHIDKIICTACSPTTQRDRLRARGLNDDQIRNRIAAQMPTEKKMDLSHYVVWTEGDLDVHDAQLKRILP